MADDGLADWVFESVLQFIKSPMWTAPILGFIEEHCGAFDHAEAENKLEYTAIHKEFCALVDSTLSGFLGDLGVNDEAFVAAIKSGRCVELSELVTEYLLSMEDFVAFRAMMERHNHELELEAMYEHARVVDGARGAAEADRDGGDDEMDEQERFLLEMAIQASLRPTDVRRKEAEVEDAELLEALALSMALEQERLVREQLAAGDDEARREAAAAEAAENQRTINDAFLRQREENAARAAAAEEEEEKTAEAGRPATPPGQATAPASATPHRSPARPAVASRVLAPVGERRGVAPAFGARGAPLPGIGAGAPATTAAPTAAPAPQPSFSELQAKQAKAGAATNAKGGPSEEEMQQRAAYLKAQREALVKAKKAEREAAVQQFQRDNGAPAPAETNETTKAQPSAEAEMRRMIALRLKEDVLREARKAAAA